ncbi:adhesion G-protein coupled receptor F3 [Channa argus]|uniref:adhesion G-protein coupled receptor F3 n=1 Tax=Channa argus TaxID=215402 RepID=UPI0035212C9D
MQTLIFLYILGVNIFQATGTEKSYQMHYMNLIIEEMALNNLTEILKLSFVNITDQLVDKIQITTSCKDAAGFTNCNCSQGYRWSDKVCQSNQKCCGNTNCTFSINQPHMCIDNTTVTINGSFTLPSDYQNCLAQQSSSEFVQCNKNVTKMMLDVYSTLKGFDILTISNYRVGSIIADFKLIIVSDVSSQELLNRSSLLFPNLTSTLNLQTSGVVRITVPSSLQCYNSENTVTCRSQEDLKTDPLWQLKNPGGQYVITNGTQAQVTSEPMVSTVKLKNITELWAGEYSCSYTKTSGGISITHKASAVMDVALLPNIYISTTPQFPHCKSESDLMNVQIDCKITQNNDSYNVSWTSPNIPAAIKVISSTGQLTYSAATILNCKSATEQQVTCSFMNRCNQTRSATININIIKATDQFCPAADGWPDAKAGYTAVLPCTKGTGENQRQCQRQSTGFGKWSDQVQMCVNQDLYDVLKKAIIVDTGLGSLDSNAATVLNSLQGATNNTGAINTFANVNTSVQVLLRLSEKPIQITYQSSVNDLLESSSNLLEKSLQNSWTVSSTGSGNSSTSNVTMPEQYLKSVEKLISVSNLTSESKKSNIEVDTCNSTGCTNTVFNVNISLSSSNSGNVKAAGFQQLQNYMSCDYDYTPNSIIVSATTDGKKSDSVEITIDFQLLSERPPNVEILCVSWDFNNSRWSSSGCRWVSSSNNARCVCTHLSSFAVLMSRKPIELPGMTQITYAGLSISIMSLVIVLVIELIVWSAVVKTNTLYLRHTTHVNISLCLLIADVCFLASSTIQISELWCETFVVLKHFCYLSMFFWMLCLSCTLLHQAVFLFHNVSKKNYLRFSLILGYVCPFLIVFITFLTNQGGAEGKYFNKSTCWLVYVGAFKGSIFTFLIPVGIIIFINLFSMLVVIMKLLDHPNITDKSHEKDKTAAKTVMRTVILLTPIFGITWAFGFGVMILDLTSGIIAYIVNYAFTVLNSFQGFLILVTTCLGDKMIREALFNRLKKNATVSTTRSESTTKLESSWKK